MGGAQKSEIDGRDPLVKCDHLRALDQQGPSGSRVRLPAPTDETGSGRSYCEVKPRFATKSKPQEWGDKVHEADGGDDNIGPRPQHGQSILAEELFGLMCREGVSSAWDDVSGKVVGPKIGRRGEEVGDGVL